MNAENKERLPLRMQPETKRRIELWYREDNCKSQNEFVEKAVIFYTDYLAAKDNSMLPTAIQSAVSGRLGLLEKNLSALAFTSQVELDLLIGIIADAFQFDRDDLQRRRSQSVRNVKSTNGRISLEKRIPLREEDDYEYEDA